MDDLGEGLHLVGSIVDLTKDILNRSDRDKLIKELNDDGAKIQNSFANNNLDDQWACAYRLFNQCGHSLTPGASVGDTERQFRFQAINIAAELKYARALISRLINKKDS